MINYILKLNCPMVPCTYTHTVAIFTSAKLCACIAIAMYVLLRALLPVCMKYTARSR